MHMCVGLCIATNAVWFNLSVRYIYIDAMCVFMYFIQVLSLDGSTHHQVNKLRQDTQREREREREREMYIYVLTCI